MKMETDGHSKDGLIFGMIKNQLAEIEQLKCELEKLKQQTNAMSNNGFKTSQFNSNFLIQNLEAQVDTLKEELDAESNLRIKLEEEVSELRNRLRSNIGEEGKVTLRNDEEIGRTTERNIGTARSEGGDLKSPQPTEEVKLHLSEMQMLYEDANQRIKELESDQEQLQSKYVLSCKTVQEAFQKIEDTLQLAQKATEEKDQALDEVAAISNELNRVRNVVELLVEETGKRTSDEVSKVREQANMNISKLLEELHAVEMERSKLTLELERVKSSSENGTIPSEPNKHIHDFDLQFEDLLKRAHQAEQERDEWRLKCETNHMTHERSIVSKENEYQHLLDEHKLLKNQLEQSQRRASVAEERLQKQTQALKSAEERAHELKRESESAQRSALQQVFRAHQELELRDAEFKRRLESAEKANQTSSQRWQELLTKQRELASKWKSEAQLLAEQLEQQGLAFRDELETERNKVNQLTRRLAGDVYR